MKTKAVLFDLLTALLDSWTVWNRAAGTASAGQAWRAAYLRRTYGCGTYRPYELLVAEAAAEVGLDARATDRLARDWDNLQPWPEAATVLQSLIGEVKLGVVTNCSVELGRRASARFELEWDVVVTAEEAGFYKPNPTPYRLAMERLGVSAEETLFVAGSGYDLFGTDAVGLRAYWHNRIGLARPEGAPLPDYESATLDAVPAWALGRTSP